MQRCVLFTQSYFDDFLGVVPRAAGIGHKDRLIQAEDRDRDQISDEEELAHTGERERNEKHCQENIEHSALGVFRANSNDPFAVFDRCAGGVAIQLDVRLDEFDRAIGAGNDGLRRGARKPINHCAASNQAQQKRRVQQRQVPLGDDISQAVGQHHDDREDQRRRTDDRGADQHGFGRGLERIARAVVLFQEMLPLFEVRVEAELLLDFVSCVRLAGQRRQFKDRLRVVGYGAVRINRDCHRPHAQEAKRDQAEGEHRGREHKVTQAVTTHGIGNSHQSDNYEPHPERAEVSSGQTGKDIE